jgi:hypothetical protein
MVSPTVATQLSPTKRPIYDRNYPSLKRFSWVWRGLATYWTFMSWFVSIPLLILNWIAPANLKDNLADFEQAIFNVLTPVVNFIQDTTYRFFHIADYTADWAIVNSTHFYNSNLKGFEHTFEHFLRNLEHRVKLLKDNGLSGIGPALSLDLGRGGPNPLIANTPLAHTPLAKYE